MESPSKGNTVVQTLYTEDEWTQVYTMGENMAEVAGYWDVLSMTNEEWLAKQFFTQWKNSPGHYELMMEGCNNSNGNETDFVVWVGLGYGNHSLVYDANGIVVANMTIAARNVKDIEMEPWFKERLAKR